MRYAPTVSAGRPVSRKSPATYADLEAVSDHLIAEILDGELYTTPRPRARHAMAASEIGGDLVPPFGRGRGGPGGWWLLDEPELHLQRDVVVPDLAGWRRERLPSIPDEGALTLRPDWVCEVLSSSTERTDRAVKLPIYAREGVPYVWLVNPSSETLEILELDAGRGVLLATHAGDAIVRAEPFDQIAIEICRWWGRDA
jgi:Uma2 family endonuclease